MIRGDNIVCGTSTTGTGTLTLAATPGPPGGIDFDVFARATGIGFGNSAAVLVSYTIIEYTDSTFATAKATEKGIGTLTLGGSSGIANCTLARTTLQTSATSLNSQPATQNIAPGTGISIGTAANTLVFIGASADDLLALTPYVQSTAGNGNGGVGPIIGLCGQGGGPNVLTAVHYYFGFQWWKPMLAKRVTILPQTAYSGGSPVSNAYGHLYAVGTDGRPGKLLYDFGLIGTANTSLNGTSVVTSGAAGNGYLMTPGEYYFDFVAVLSGGVTAPKISTANPGSAVLNAGLGGLFNNLPTLPCFTTDASGASNPAPDPAYLTGWTLDTTSTDYMLFNFRPS